MTRYGDTKRGWIKIESDWSPQSTNYTRSFYLHECEEKIEDYINTEKKYDDTGVWDPAHSESTTENEDGNKITCNYCGDTRTTRFLRTSPSYSMGDA